MRTRQLKRRGADADWKYPSRRDRQAADLFWASLVGEPAAAGESFPGRVLTSRSSAPPAEAILPAPPDEDSGEVLDLPAEALPAGQTASPCDVSKTSETLDQFAHNSSTLTAAHRTTIDTLSDCLLALRADPRPVRNVDIVGFTDPTGTATFNQGLGRRRARAVRHALVTALNTRSAGSAATFNFRLRSAGAALQIAGGNPANRRVEVSVEIAVSEIVVHASDTDTHKIASSLGAAGLEHFCCVKNTGDIVLQALISPNISGAIGGRLSWGATGAAITSPAVGTDRRTAKLSSAAAGKFPIQLSWDGAVVRRAVVWVIWSRINVTCTRPPAAPPIAGFAGLSITAGIDHTFAIDPPTITTDADRPALDGPNTAPVPGAALTHVISGNPLAGGAVKKWDASRQIRMKVLNPHLYPVAQLPPVTGHVWNGQPAASTVPENYPANDALGNDDTHHCDETNNPYENCGLVTALDNPRMSMANATGSNGDTFETRFQFREFLRVNLGTTWYRASDFSLWRFHARFLRRAGAWTENGSTLARDNAGF
jgi:outer membrane protein OmpA-like peptidoglycan-associated protein